MDINYFMRLDDYFQASPKGDKSKDLHEKILKR